MMWGKGDAGSRKSCRGIVLALPAAAFYLYAGMCGVERGVETKQEANARRGQQQQNAERGGSVSSVPTLLLPLSCDERGASSRRELKSEGEQNTKKSAPRPKNKINKASLSHANSLINAKSGVITFAQYTHMAACVISKKRCVVRSNSKPESV